MSADNVIDGLLGAGLIQLGSFEGSGDAFSCRLRLDMLASYPHVLKMAAEGIASILSGQTLDRLLCTHDSQPLGTLVSQMMGIPLVIHTGVAGNPVHHLIGAYDIGHPTALISMTPDYADGFIAGLMKEADGVGLACMEWVVLVDSANTANVPRRAVITLADIVNWMVRQGEISVEAAKNIR